MTNAVSLRDLIITLHRQGFSVESIAKQFKISEGIVRSAIEQ